MSSPGVKVLGSFSPERNVVGRTKGAGSDCADCADCAGCAEILLASVADDAAKPPLAPVAGEGAAEPFVCA